MDRHSTQYTNDWKHCTRYCKYHRVSKSIKKYQDKKSDFIKFIVSVMTVKQKIQLPVTHSVRCSKQSTLLSTRDGCIKSDLSGT